MGHQQLGTYLNNHLTASVGALELLSSLETENDDMAIRQMAGELRAEIETEQQELKRLVDRLEITESMPRQAIGWLGEKLTQVKLRLDDNQDGDLHLLESLELLLIGIEGKSALWRAFAHAAVPGLPISEYERYATRSQDQQRRVETFRLAAAKKAFSI